MKITALKSHVLARPLSEPLGYSQQFYTRRTAHLVEVRTDEGLIGWGEVFGAGNVALANKAIVERVIAPLMTGEDAYARDYLWHKVYNLLRDHGQKGMPIQALSGVDIALWDIAAQAAGLPLWRYLGGGRRRVPVYGYGMMLRQDNDLGTVFADEARRLQRQGYSALKMKVGLGTRADVRLAQAVRAAVGEETLLMVDANHCYTTSDAFYVGQALDELGVYWFEEPVAPEDRDGYRFLRERLSTNIAGGEAEFTRWGWRDLLREKCLDIAQPEVCGLGGISEYLKVQALLHAHFVPIVNHVWGSAVAVAVNLHLLSAMPDLPGGMHPWQPMLEHDTTPNPFRDELPQEPLGLARQIAECGAVSPPSAPGIGVAPKPEVLARYAVA